MPDMVTYPVVVAGALIAGYLIKKVDTFPNKFIPLCLAGLGATFAVVLNLQDGQPIQLQTFIFGAFSGLASTGLHQAFTKIVEGVPADQEDNND